MKKRLTEQLRVYAVDQGADLLGVASAEDSAWKEAPEGFRPKDILKSARNLIVIAVRVLGVDFASGTNSPIYSQGYITANNELNRISRRIVLFLKDQGHEAVAVPATYWVPTNRVFEKSMPALAHRHAAVLAGLGEIGLNNLLITPQYGPRVRLVSILTDSQLKASPRFKGTLCNGCKNCIVACPVNAIDDEGKLDPLRCWKQHNILVQGKRVSHRREALRFPQKWPLWQEEFPMVCGLCIKACPVGTNNNIGA